MPDDDKKQEEKVAAEGEPRPKEGREEAREEAESAAEAAEKSAEEAKDAAQEAETASDAAEEAAKEVKKEVKEEKAAEKIKPSKPSVKVSKKLEDLIGEIEKLSVLELSELVKALEDKFQVSAAPVAMAANGVVGSATADEGVSEQTTFNVIIADAGATKISVIKAVREIVPTLGLKEAKDLVDAAPKQLLEGVNKENATEAKQKLEAAGAKVELK